MPKTGATSRALILSALPDVPGEQLEAAAAALSGLVEVRGLDDALENAGSAQVVVLTLSPVGGLALTLQSGEDAEAALEAWCTQRRAFLTRQRRMRRQLTLVDLGILTDAGRGDCTALGKRLGVDFGPVEGMLDAVPMAAAQYRIAAATFLAVDADAQALAEELRANTHGAAGSTVDRAAVVLSLQQWQQVEAERLMLRQGMEQHIESTERDAEAQALRAALSARIEGLEAELAATREALSDQQGVAAEEQRARDTAHDMLVAERDALTAELAAVRDALEAALAAAREDREQLRTTVAELAEAQAEVARVSGDIATKSAEAAALQRVADEGMSELATAEGKLVEARREIALLQESTAAQFEAFDEQVAQLQALKNEVADLSEKTADHELLRAEFDAVTRKLEMARRDARLREAVLGAALMDDARTMGALESENAQAWHAIEQERGAWTAQREGLTRSLDALRAENETFSDELARVYGSKSWKVTGPLRAGRHKVLPPRG